MKVWAILYYIDEGFYFDFSNNKKVTIQGEYFYKHARSAKAAAIKFAKRHNFEIVEWEDA